MASEISRHVEKAKVLDYETTPPEERYRVVWLVPTHLVRLETYKKFLASLRRFAPEIEAAVVYASHSEAVAFAQQGCRADIVFVLEDYFSPEEVEAFLAKRSITNVKRLFGVKTLFQQPTVSRVIVTDDEVEIYQPLGLKRVLDYAPVYSFHKVSNEFLRKVIASPLALLTDPGEKLRVQDFFVEGDFYGWFSDMPIYEREHIERFFERYGLRNTDDFSRLSFEFFDWIMYAYSKFLDVGSAKFYKLPWPIVSHAASWFEMGYRSRRGRKLLKAFFSFTGSLWIADRTLSAANPGAIAVFNTDRNYRALNFYLAIPIRCYIVLRSVFGKLLRRP